MKGRVIWWNPKQGCGYISCNNDDIFVHLFTSDLETYHLKENQVLEFELEENVKGLFLKRINLLLFN